MMMMMIIKKTSKEKLVTAANNYNMNRIDFRINRKIIIKSTKSKEEETTAWKVQVTKENPHKMTLIWLRKRAIKKETEFILATQNDAIRANNSVAERTSYFCLAH